jgi:metal-sulfur cluster biosynthetic enzyme
LRTCFDPEIPVNIVELGLVYSCQVMALPDGGYKAEVTFTLTAPGCGMGEVLRTDMRNKLLRIPHIREVAVQVVLDPPWQREMMSEAAKLQLGLV